MAMVRNLETIFSIITKQYDDTDDVNDIINDLNTNTLTIRNDDNEWRAIWFLTGVQKNVRVEKHLPWSLVYADKVCTTKLQREDCDLMGNVRFQFYSGSSISDVMSRLTFEVRFMYLGEKEWRCIPLKMNDGFAEAHIDILFPTARLNYHDINFEYRVRNISNLKALSWGFDMIITSCTSSLVSSYERACATISASESIARQTMASFKRTTTTRRTTNHSLVLSKWSRPG